MQLRIWRLHKDTRTYIAHLPAETLRRFTANVDLRKILPEHWHIFSLPYFSSNMRVYSRKIHTSEIVGRYSQSHMLLVGSYVCTFQYPNFYPNNSACISMTLTLSTGLRTAASLRQRLTPVCLCGIDTMYTTYCISAFTQLTSCAWG